MAKRYNMKSVNFDIPKDSENLEREIDNLLAKKGNQVSDWGQHLIRSLAWYGHFRLLKKYLKDKDADPTYEGNGVWMDAREQGHWDIAEYLLNDERVFKNLSKIQLTYPDVKKFIKKNKIGKFKDFLDI